MVQYVRDLTGKVAALETAAAAAAAAREAAALTAAAAVASDVGAAGGPGYQGYGGQMLIGASCARAAQRGPVTCAPRAAQEAYAPGAGAYGVQPVYGVSSGTCARA